MIGAAIDQILSARKMQPVSSPIVGYVLQIWPLGQAFLDLQPVMGPHHLAHARLRNHVRMLHR